MSADLLQWLIEATLMTSAAIAIVLALRPILARLFGARAAIGLWLLVPLALTVTVVPDRIIEVEEFRPGATPTPVLERLSNGLPMPSDEANDDGLRHLISLLWSAGGLVTLVLMANRQRLFRRRLGTLQPVGRRLYRSGYANHGPLLIGALNPGIIVPCDFASRFGARQRRLMLAHEYTHLKRGDPVWNLVAAGLRCLFWFNPLVHWSATRFQRDQELACDAQVLARHSNAVRVYAEALLTLDQPEPRLPALAFGAHPLKERIMNLSTLKSQSQPRQRFGLVLSMSLAAVFACAAWAATPELIDEKADATAHQADDAAMFAFDVEVTVNGTTQTGGLALQGDMATMRLDGDAATMHARDRLKLTHADPESGWSAEIDIERIDDEQFNVNARITKQGEVVASPRMIIGAEHPAWVESTDPDTGEIAYRIKLIPVNSVH